MDAFCEGCAGRGQEDCALPSIAQKLNDMAHYLGEELLVSVVSGGVFRPAYVPEYSRHLRDYRDGQLERREQAITACIGLHQAQPLY